MDVMDGSSSVSLIFFRSLCAKRFILCLFSCFGCVYIFSPSNLYNFSFCISRTHLNGR